MCATSDAYDIATMVEEKLGELPVGFYDQVVEAADKAIRKHAKLTRYYTLEDAVFDLKHGYKSIDDLEREAKALRTDVEAEAE